MKPIRLTTCVNRNQEGHKFRNSDVMLHKISTLSQIEYIGARPRAVKKPITVKGALFLLVLISLVGVMTYQTFVQDSSAAVPSSLTFAEEGSDGSTGLEKTDRLSQFLNATIERTQVEVAYDPNYYEIGYPNGDIPKDRGMCTDLIIRSYRAIGVDLQQLVHEDMQEHFDTYSTTWKLAHPDPNMDHRRIPNLQNFFSRKAGQLPVTHDSKTYAPGDIVTWTLTHGASHIGIVVPNPKSSSDRPWVVHNVGLGPQWEDSLFSYQITGHYRYKLDEEDSVPSAS